MNRKFPFPNYELAKRELTYDNCYSKIPEEKCEEITKMAWLKGSEIARLYFHKYDGNMDFCNILKNKGFLVNVKDTDYVSGNQRYFCHILPKQKEVNLYKKSVELWARENDLEYEMAQNIILAHEFFHYLEYSELGYLSKLYMVPMIKIGKIRIGNTGIRALSEIGAHSFARNYFVLAGLFEKEDIYE